MKNKIEEFNKILLAEYFNGADKYRIILEEYKQSRFYVEHSQWPFWGSFDLYDCFTPEIINFNRCMRAMIDAMVYCEGWAKKPLHCYDSQYIFKIKSQIRGAYNRSKKITDNELIAFICAALATFHDVDHDKELNEFLLQEFNKNANS